MQENYNAVMLKRLKNYLALCLIGLQLFAPFIHAHAFGLDTFYESAVHIHSNTVATQPFTNMQVDADVQQQVGYVVTVASGVAPQEGDLDFNTLLGLAVFFCLVLLFAAQTTALIFRSLPPPFLKRHIYAPSSPRAPPRPLNQI